MLYFQVYYFRWMVWGKYPDPRVALQACRHANITPAARYNVWSLRGLHKPGIIKVISGKESSLLNIEIDFMNGELNVILAVAVYNLVCFSTSLGFLQDEARFVGSIAFSHFCMAGVQELWWVIVFKRLEVSSEARSPVKMQTCDIFSFFVRIT